MTNILYKKIIQTKAKKEKEQQFSLFYYLYIVTTNTLRLMLKSRESALLNVDQVLLLSIIKSKILGKKYTISLRDYIEEVTFYNITK